METRGIRSQAVRIARSLRHRNFKLFFVGQSVSLIGTWLTRVATSWLVYRLTHSAQLLGLVSFAGLIPTFVIAPVAGVLADRWNKRRALVATQVAALLQSAALAALTISGRITITELVWLSVFQGVINAFDMPIRQSMLVHMIEDRADLPNAIALNSSMVNMARLVGPSFAGILIAIVGEGGCFAIDAVSYLAVIATLLMMSFPARTAAKAPAKHVHREIAEGFQYAWRSRPVLAVLGLLALVSLMGAPYMTLLPIIVGQLGGDAKSLGYLTGASGLGALGGALFLAARTSSIGLGRIIAVSAFAFGASLVLFGLSRSIWLSLPIMVVCGLGMMLQMAASNTVLQTLTDERRRGRVMSLFLMSFTGTQPVGSLIAGYLAERIGAARTLELGGLACCAAALAFARALPRIRRSARRITEPIEMAE